MKTRGSLISLLALILSATCMQAEMVSNARFLDFKCVEDECSFGYYVWNITASPNFPGNGIGSTLLINIENSQTRIQVSSLIGKRIALAIRPIYIENPQSSRWVGEQPQGHPLLLHSFSVRLSGSEVVSWTKFANDYLFTTRNFRVYLTEDENPVGCVWVTERPTQTAIENRYFYNCFPYSFQRDDHSYPTEEGFLRSIMGPVWVALTGKEGFLSPKELVFPTVEELLEQHPFAIAMNTDEYIESSAIIWERPYLLPPVLKLKAEVDTEEALRTLKSLQRDVSISRIGIRPRDFRIRNEDLLEYYLEIIDDASPLRGCIERNLEIVRKSSLGSTSGKPAGGAYFGPSEKRLLPIRRKPHVTPVTPIDDNDRSK